LPARTGRRSRRSQSPSTRRAPPRFIGAIGCSGGTGSQDEVTCKAGLEGLKR